jgi:ribosomal protein S18 acetylase RimI-like enzyme
VASLVEPASPDLGKVRSFLTRDPIRHTAALGRLFHDGGWRAMALGDPPAAVLLQDNRRPKALIVAAEGASAAQEALEMVPPGDYSVALADASWIPFLSSSMGVTYSEEAYLLHLTKDRFRPFGDPRLPPVPPSEAPVVAAAWDDEDRTEYIRERLQRGPSVGVWAGEELVGWYGTHTATDWTVNLGFLYVKGNYRGRGYARMLATALASQVLDQGKAPVCHVQVDNQASLRLHQSIGFLEYCRQGWIGLRRE